MRKQLDLGAMRAGVTAAGLLVIAILVGSGGLRHFDPALIAYTSASVIAAFGIVYRYSVWLQRPPTRLYWRRGWELFLRPSRLAGNAAWLARLLWTQVVAQTFVARRDRVRWRAHLLISWGCLAAAAVTFPLVFGWVHFEADPRDPSAYRAFVLGVAAGVFPAHSLVGWLTFHVLDLCAVAILVGMAWVFRRRMFDRGAMSVQQFGMDFLPLVLLFAICVTGLMLTVSSLWMRGYSYTFLAMLHAFTVIVTLLYLPFGKFFHVFQRPANLGVHFYRREGDETGQTACARCGSTFAAEMHVRDLEIVLDQLGIDQGMEGGGHYQRVCPPCRRKLVALTQLDAIGGPGFL